MWVAGSAPHVDPLNFVGDALLLQLHPHLLAVRAPRCATRGKERRRPAHRQSPPPEEEKDEVAPERDGIMGGGGLGRTGAVAVERDAGASGRAEEAELAARRTAQQTQTRTLRT